MTYLYPEKYGYNFFTVLYHNKTFKARKLGWYYSSVWEAYVIIAYDKNKTEYKFPLKPRRGCDSLLKNLLYKAKTDGLINLTSLS